MKAHVTVPQGRVSWNLAVSGGSSRIPFPTLSCADAVSLIELPDGEVAHERAQTVVGNGVGGVGGYT